MDKELAVNAIALNFTTELNFIDCFMGFSEIRFEMTKCKQLTFLVFSNFELVFKRFVFIRANKKSIFYVSNPDIREVDLSTNSR